MQSRGDLQRALTIIGETLLDFQTTHYCADPELNEALKKTGSQPTTANIAAYHFYPSLDAAAFAGIEHAPIGTHINPEQTATLCIGLPPVTEPSPRLALVGPGVQGTDRISVPGVTTAFWALRERRRQYPLGWDVLFVLADGTVIGIPRSTNIFLEG